ncbi:hypothetical protein, partial [Marinobacterium sediminicola]|uniref:hypothetical protein n=1 Tax=Marinobacterium sediminicola TaxID=518898 RepID=UPI0031D12835
LANRAVAQPVVSSEAHILLRRFSMSTIFFVFCFSVVTLHNDPIEIKEADSTSETYSVSRTYLLLTKAVQCFANPVVSSEEAYSTHPRLGVNAFL